MLVRELLNDKNNRTALNEKDREKLAFLSMDCASPQTYTSPKRSVNLLLISEQLMYCLQCFDAVGWAAGRASGL